MMNFVKSKNNKAINPLIIPFILAFIITTNNAFSQSYQQLLDSAKFYTTKADYKNALPWGEKALQQAEKELGG